MVWHELKPAAGDPLSEFPSVMTDQAVTLRQGLEQHLFWTDSSGASAGVPRFADGTAGPGAARSFFDVESNASSQVSATKALGGRLFVASDTSRLFAYAASGHSVLAGSAFAIVHATSTATIPSNTQTLVQLGSFSMASTSTTTTAFPSAYSAAPIVQLMPMSTGTTNFWTAAVLGSTTTNFTTRLGVLFGNASPLTVYWRSHGTVSL